ncbi:hypothetical protein ACILDT_05780, partial [Capnocytophaga canis]|uniref:hypothetical protein n=1 Tax=Capnocytophaga canis TaxID=1848903 RepID=UPI0037D4B393
LRKSYSLFLAYSSAELVSSSNQCAKYKHFLSIKKAPFFTTLPSYKRCDETTFITTLFSCLNIIST